MEDHWRRDRGDGRSGSRWRDHEWKLRCRGGGPRSSLRKSPYGVADGQVLEKHMPAAEEAAAEKCEDDDDEDNGQTMAEGWAAINREKMEPGGLIVMG